MLNFNRISPIADFCSKTDRNLQIIMKNLLYVTHELDKVHKLVKTLVIDKDLQTTVDTYFEEDRHTNDSDDSGGN